MKKYIFKIVLYLLTLTGCTHFHIYQQTTPIIKIKNKNFKDYLDMFTKIGSMYSNKEIRIPKVTVKFGKIKEFGICTQKNGNPVIIIDKDKWKTLYPHEREQLMFHEFGHCLLNRNHCNILAYGVPMSIMHKDKFINIKQYEKAKYWFFIELFDAFTCNKE